VFVDLLSLASYMTGLSIAEAVSEDRKEALQAIVWVCVSASFSATKSFFTGSFPV
jgi:hypothetical protein